MHLCHPQRRSAPSDAYPPPISSHLLRACFFWRPLRPLCRLYRYMYQRGAKADFDLLYVMHRIGRLVKRELKHAHHISKRVCDMEYC